MVTHKSETDQAFSNLLSSLETSGIIQTAHYMPNSGVLTAIQFQFKTATSTLQYLKFMKSPIPDSINRLEKTMSMLHIYHYHKNTAQVDQVQVDHKILNPHNLYDFKF